MPYYTDIDLSLEAHPHTGDLMRKNDISAVRESLKNIILTNPLEKPFNATYGVGLKRYLFELTIPGLAEALKKEIKEQCRVFEPRAVIETINVGVDDEHHEIVIDINFYVQGIEFLNNLNLVFDRVR